VEVEAEAEAEEPIGDTGIEMIEPEWAALELQRKITAAEQSVVERFSPRTRRQSQSWTTRCTRKTRRRSSRSNITSSKETRKLVYAREQIGEGSKEPTLSGETVPAAGDQTSGLWNAETKGLLGLLESLTQSACP
jgi:hypothetical protein